MKVVYSEEALTDLVNALTYLHERSPKAALMLDDEIAHAVERLANHIEGPESRLRSGVLVRSWAVPPFRIYYQRQHELLIVRIYHQARRPIAK